MKIFFSKLKKKDFQELKLLQILIHFNLKKISHIFKNADDIKAIDYAWDWINYKKSTI